MKQPIQWTTGTHKGRSEAANGARLINLYPEVLPADSKAPVVLYGTPGTEYFTYLPTSPIHGLGVLQGNLYAITGNALYRVNEDGSYVVIGPVEITGRVSVANGWDQIVFVDGVKGYAYSEGGGLVELAGEGWYPAGTVTYQDGHFIFTRTGTAQFFITDLFSVTFDPLMYASAEGKPDNIVAAISDHRELWLFCEHSVEVWYNSGDPDFPFERIQGPFIETGIGAQHSVAAMDNSIFWLGENGIVYRITGYQPARISTHAVEYDIQGGDLSDAFAYTYTDEGHAFYVLTFPGQNKTWCFDVATGEWHERSHVHEGRHHSNCYTWCYRKHFVGDFQSGLIYRMDLDALDDVTEIIKRTAISPPLSAQRSRVFCHSLEMDMETGLDPHAITGEIIQEYEGTFIVDYFGNVLVDHNQAYIVGYEEPGDPTAIIGPVVITINNSVPAMLQWSDDGGKTWSNERWAATGAIGDYLTRLTWNRLGSFRQRQFKVVISGKIPVVILGAYVEVEHARH